ncbi:MAG: hypothetical protein MI923_08890 [Phycisphaerales bacterium]|nr:hypothetical protein [Phycisphaerales bacterium]
MGPHVDLGVGAAGEMEVADVPCDGAAAFTESLAEARDRDEADGEDKSGQGLDDVGVIDHGRGQAAEQACAGPGTRVHDAEAHDADTIEQTGPRHD